MITRIRTNLFWLLGTSALALGILGFQPAERARPPWAHESVADLAPHPSSPNELLVASEQRLYLRKEKNRWERLFTLTGTTQRLRKIVTHPLLPEHVFLLTDEFLLEFDLKRKQKRFLLPQGFSKIRLFSLSMDPQDPSHLYVATDQGLYLSGDRGETWLRPFRWPESERTEIVAILPTNPPTFLLATRRELFISKDEGESFESGFSVPALTEEVEPEADEESEEQPIPQFTSVAFTLAEPQRTWIGTERGVFESHDGGLDWERLPETGLDDPRITDLAYADRNQMLFAATPRGVARYLPHQRRWEAVPLHLSALPSALALQQRPGTSEEVLYVASVAGIVEWTVPPVEGPAGPPVLLPSPERLELFRNLVTLEPSVREVQQAAIRYADLGNGKIKRWQWGSRLRAFIPRLTFGRDFSLGSNIDIDRGGTNNPDVFILGPEDIDQSWNLDLAWELGDLLYSSAQTSIDSRAKLLVELRESILGEVTRIYFERRRLQAEFFLSPPASPQEHADLLLRLEELTAHLDALTDGFLSGKLVPIKKNHPELQKLWQEMN